VKYIILQIVKIYTTFKDINILSLCLRSTRRINMKRFGNTLNGRPCNITLVVRTFVQFVCPVECQKIQFFISGCNIKPEIWFSRNSFFVSVVRVYVGLPSELSIHDSLSNSLCNDFPCINDIVRDLVCRDNNIFFIKAIDVFCNNLGLLRLTCECSLAH